MPATSFATPYGLNLSQFPRAAAQARVRTQEKDWWVSPGLFYARALTM
jgi:hypothetical protein